MKTYNKLKQLTIGHIEPKGFLLEQMERSCDGMGGHLDDLEPSMIKLPYINKTNVSKWGKGNQSGWGGEISGNYYAALIGLAYTLKDLFLIEKAEIWVNTMIKKQKPDGYLGTYYEEDANIYEDFNGWGTTCAMKALMKYYDITKQKYVLEAVHRCMLWFCDKWSGDKKTPYAGKALIEAMCLCYMHVRDQRLLDFAYDYLQYLTEHDYFRISYRSFLSDEFEYNSNHAAGYANSVKMPAIYYMVTGEKVYLDATIKGLEKVRSKCVLDNGGISSTTEYLAPICSTAETEYCAYTNMQNVYAYMSYITGEAKYGDYIENLFYNGAQGARKKDEKAIAYFSSPNQIYATELSSNSFGNHQVYAPCHPVACCAVNSVAILHEFVSSMALTDESDNLYIPVYGPCKINYNDIIVEENTYYPFRNFVSFVILCEKHFALNLKNPEWSEETILTVNEERISANCNEYGYIAINRHWKKGDVVTIRFHTSVQVHYLKDDDFCKNHPIAFSYGALLFSLPIEENWVKIPGDPVTPLPEDYSWYNVKPYVHEPEFSDIYTRFAKHREYTSWNVALDENISSADVEVCERDLYGYPWESPPISLKLTGYKAPFLCSNYPQRTFEVYGERVYTTKAVDLELVPYGCCTLRITYFPKKRK